MFLLFLNHTIYYQTDRFVLSFYNSIYLIEYKPLLLKLINRIERYINKRRRIKYMEEELKLLGLNDTDIKVYLTLLKLNQTIASEISKKSEIPRASIYDILR
ncbi:MAG: hypothetical protein KAI26_06950, partial [Nanoarchaeota archaeon]|nr:hypothetical protein [Nanoarchaeota archaeon]